MTTFEIMEEISKIHLELQGAQALEDVIFNKLFAKDKPDQLAYEMEYDQIVLLNYMSANQVDHSLEQLDNLKASLEKTLREREGVA